jgi:hypothetical protein
VSITTTSAVLTSGIDDAQNALLMKWCDIAATNGGSFSIDTKWVGNWQRTYTINWPTEALAVAQGAKA